MTEPAADTSAILAETDSLVLASMASPIEMELVTTWLDQRRAAHPGANFDLVTLPALDAPPEAMTSLAEQLESGRTVRSCRCGCFGYPRRIAGVSRG